MAILSLKEKTGEERGWVIVKDKLSTTKSMKRSRRELAIGAVINSASSNIKITKIRFSEYFLHT